MRIEWSNLGHTQAEAATAKGNGPYLEAVNKPIAVRGNAEDHG